MRWRMTWCWCMAARPARNTMAISLCKLFGVTIIVTCGSDEMQTGARLGRITLSIIARRIMSMW